MIEHKSRQNKKRKCLKIDNLLKKNRIEGGVNNNLDRDSREIEKDIDIDGYINKQWFHS